MLIALAQSAKRIATVCDFAEELRLVETDEREYRELSCEAFVNTDDAHQRARRIAASGAEVLLCGDCSRELYAELARLGLRVVASCHADPDSAIRALIAEKPIARRHRHRRRHRQGCCRRNGQNHPQRTTPMMIAIAASERDLDAPLDPRFGRAKYFCLVDEAGEGGSFFDNPNDSSQHGAGLRSAAYVLDLGAKAVISGDVGPKAMGVLKEGNCACYAADGGSLREVLAAWKAGELRRIDQ